MSATMWRPPAIHSVKHSSRPQNSIRWASEEQKVFRQVVDEIHTVIELEIEHFIFCFRIYVKYAIKCEQKQGVYDRHYD